MTISERFRELSRDVRQLAATEPPVVAGVERLQRLLQQVVQLLAEEAERVGDIPQYKLEQELTPVLLKAHNRLDQARLILEQAEETAAAQRIWELEQAIYRLLNSL